MVLRAEEIPLNVNFAFAQAQLPLLRATVGFGLLLPLAVAGTAAVALDAARRRDPDLWLPPLLAGAYALAVAAFFVSDRYRLPLVPLLIPLAGHGLVAAFAAVKQRTRATAVILAAAAVTAIAVHYPFARFRHPEYAKDYFELGKVHRERRQYDEALALFRKAAALLPDQPEPLVEIASIHYFAGRPLDAERDLRRALALNAGFAAARRNLALLYKSQGLYDEALRFAADDAQRAAIAAARDAATREQGETRRLAQTQYDVGMQHYGARRLAEARYAFMRAAAADPSNDTAHFALALVNKDLRLRADACAAIEKAAALRPDDGEYRTERELLCGPAQAASETTPTTGAERR